MESIFSHSPALARDHADSSPKRRSGFFGWLLGCRHRRMSRPFTHDGETYRVCIKCGAHRMFDMESWRMQGPYYFIAPAPNRSFQSTITYASVSERGFH